MLDAHLFNNITQKLGHIPTSCQKKLIELLSEFVLSVENQRVFLIKGYAGTGKTSIISSLIKVFELYKIKSVLLAPTGRAAKVFSHYSGKQAFTIHKKIYRQVGAKDGFGKFMLEKNLHSNTFFIVDEASMIANNQGDFSLFGTGRLLDDLIEYVYTGKNCKLILTGDTAQLPPVGISVSPALDAGILKNYYLNVTESELTEVVRQTASSGILKNATVLRNLVSQAKVTLPKFNLSNFSDIMRINGQDLIEKISESYDKVGQGETIVISRSNKRANMYNNGIRNKILYREEQIVPGDLLMVVKNNYHWLKENEETEFIANGDIVEILKIRKYQNIYGYNYADVRVRMIDYDLELECKILLDTLNVDSASLPSEQNKNLFYKIYEDYADLKPKKKGFDMVKNNSYFNALQVKFAYAVTCHKAQGGQWKNAFIDQGYVDEKNIDIEYLRWLYTALTRSSEKVYLINFPDRYFE